MDSHVLELDDYELANLRALLEACGYGPAARGTTMMRLQTGDWMGQIWHKLPKVDYAPNRSPEEMVALVGPPTGV